MVFITADTFAENCLSTIKQEEKDNTVVLWITMKDLNGKLDIKNIFDLVGKEIKGKFKDKKPTEEQIRKYKSHGSEFDKDVKFVYAREDVVMPVIMGGRSPEAIKCRSKLGFTQHDITLKKESSVLKSIMETFEGEDMETQYIVLNCRVDLYFHDYKLAIEIDEKEHKDRNEDYETKKKTKRN